MDESLHTDTNKKKKYLLLIQILLTIKKYYFQELMYNLSLKLIKILEPLH